MQERYKSIQIN